MLARRRKMSFLSFYPAQWKSVPHFSLREYTYQVTIQVANSCRLWLRARRREVTWGHPRPRQEDCVPCTPYCSDTRNVQHGDQLSTLPSVSGRMFTNTTNPSLFFVEDTFYGRTSASHSDCAWRNACRPCVTQWQAC